MSILHRIQVPPADPNAPAPIPSLLGEWESCAGEVHTFYEPMVRLTLAINADHTLHMFCEADQVDAVAGVLTQRLVEATLGLKGGPVGEAES
jgi:hypothetical protein